MSKSERIRELHNQLDSIHERKLALLKSFEIGWRDLEHEEEDANEELGKIEPAEERNDG
jgi:hypothetical protein